MNGSDFYSLATSLATVGGAAEKRTAISRAYYGAFHRAGEFLQSIGISMPSGPECHRKLRMILDQAGDKDVLLANSKLSSLRTARNDADYDLADRSHESVHKVQLNLAAAKEIMECIDSCFPGQPKASIHASLRNYAATVLRLVVSK